MAPKKVCSGRVWYGRLKGPLLTTPLFAILFSHKKPHRERRHRYRDEYRRRPRDYGRSDFDSFYDEGMSHVSQSSMPSDRHLYDTWARLRALLQFWPQQQPRYPHHAFNQYPTRPANVGHATAQPPVPAGHVPPPPQAAQPGFQTAPPLAQLNPWAQLPLQLGTWGAPIAPAPRWF